MEYKKTHTNTKALVKHAEKITERGGTWKIKGMRLIYHFNSDEDLSERFFSITKSIKWKLGDKQFVRGENHKKAMDKINIKTKRITNKRFRDIEKTGSFYYVEEKGNGNKTFIFEIM